MEAQKQQQHRQHPLRLVHRDNGLCDLVDQVTHFIVAFSVDETVGHWIEVASSDAFPFCTENELLDTAYDACEAGRLTESERLASEHREREMRARAIVSEVKAVALAGVGL